MMPTRTRQWLSNRMSSHLEWPASRVADLKGDTTVSVVLPAKDEQETVGTIVTTIRESLVEQIPVVAEIVVIDSRSTDETAKVAARAGATVYAQDDILSDLPGLWGKGEALWKSLAVTNGDIVVFVDSDIRNFGTHFVTGLQNCLHLFFRQHTDFRFFCQSEIFFHLLPSAHTAEDHTYLGHIPQEIQNNIIPTVKLL